MKTFILTRVHSCVENDDPKDLAKGVTHILVLETTKQIGKMEVPDFIKAKAITKIDPTNEPELFEALIFNITPQDGGKDGGKKKTETYYRILRKANFAGGKK